MCVAGDGVSPLIGKPYTRIAESKVKGGIGTPENLLSSGDPSSIILDVEQLRRIALHKIKRGGRGTQVRIATAATINEGKFSTFLHRRTTLPEPSLARLHRALNQVTL